MSEIEKNLEGEVDYTITIEDENCSHLMSQSETYVYNGILTYYIAMVVNEIQQ